jgi:hypothetical protein
MMNGMLLHLIMVLSLLVPGAPAVAQPVDLALTTDRTEFMLGEPVVVLVGVKNIGHDTMYVSPEFGPEGGNVDYIVTGPGGKAKAFSPLYVQDRADFRPLAPGQTVRGTARIFYGGNGYTFQEPGNYSVVASMGKSRSSPLRLKVLPPQNAAEREQARLILDKNEVGLFLMLEGGDELSEAQKQIEELISRYPDALLTSYVRYAVAKNLSVPAKNFVSQKPRSADMPRAIAILQSLTGKEMVLYYQARVATTLASLMSKTNRPEEARTVLQEFQSKVSRRENVRPWFLPEIEQRLKNMK